MLFPRLGQDYQSSTAINNPSEKIGIGIYCSPHFQVCLDYSEPVQCRAKPKKIKIVQEIEDYWVINEPKNIRPYGILLIKEENLGLIKNPEEMYGERFSWEDSFNVFTG